MKTIYMFYLVCSEIDKRKFPAVSNDEIIKHGNLRIYPYAWTTNKSFRKQFKNMRDMNKFHEKVIKINESEFEIFANSNSELLLEFRRLSTRSFKNNTITSESIKILSTYREISYSSFHLNDIIYNIISEDLYTDYVEFLNPKLYNNNFMKMLNKIKIKDIIYDVKNIDKLPFSINNMDSLNIYITAFANTYKK